MAHTVPFRRIAVIGTGLVGGSFALAVRKRFPGVDLVGFDRPPTAALASQQHIVDRMAADLASAVSGADLVYIALPIGAAIESLPAIAAAAEPAALVTDACSTKVALCQAASQPFKNGARFLGGHPMAGKESSGVEHADADLFRGAPYALVGQQDESDSRVSAFAELVAAIGARPIWTDPATHDWAVGIVSHLPQLVSIALARVVQDESDETGLPLSLAGHGLQDTLRLAGSPYRVWRDILLTNTENISRALDRLEKVVRHLRTQLARQEIEREFDAANQLYKLLSKPQ
jgi:prephenate dehydrogenase